MLNRVAFGLFICLTAAALPAHAAAVNVTSWRFDETRTGENLSETQLTPSNVNSMSFGKLYSYGVDGYVYAQPLYLAARTTAGGTHNVLFVATEHDSVFAFDADKNQQLWKASLIDTAHGAPAGATTVPSTDLGTNDIVPEIGITGTPVIDATAGTLYVVAKSKEGGVYVSRLHALDVSTGSEKSGSPVVIQGSVPGTGIGNINNTVAFQPRWELNRTGLLLFNRHVYVAFGAHGDNGPYHGWIFSFDAATLQQTGIFNTSPQGKGDGIWHSGAAPAADTVNGVPRLFFAAGNFVDPGNHSNPNPTPPYTDAQNYSNAIVRMDLSSGGGMQVSDEWTPFDQLKLSDADLDQTSGGILMLPDQTGPNVHELIQVGKNGRIEVLDRDNLGGFNTSYNNTAQEITDQIRGLWSTPAYWNGNVYFWGNGDTLKQFSLRSGQLSTTPIAKSAVVSNFPGVSPVISSNGTSAGVLWAIRSDAYNVSGPALLYAFDSTNVATQLYSSATNAARDSAGKAVKFVVPVVTNGKVYVGAQGEVDVYGLLAASPPTAPTPTLTPAPGAYATVQSIALADTFDGVMIYYTTDGTPPSANSTRYTGPFAVSVTSAVQAFATAPGYNPSGVVSGTYTIGAVPTIDFSNGFASVKGLTLNGSAVNSDDSRLQLTAGGTFQAGSAFSNVPVNIQSFVGDFTFQLSGSPPLADGITFTIQADGPTALGPHGGGLGYGPYDPNITVGGIPHSIAVKLDVYNNAGEGNDSTGVYVNGASPTIPAINLTSSGIVLSSGDTISAHIFYDGSYLYLTLKDPVSGGVYVGRTSINIPTTIGATTAYVGFTGATGGSVASQKILTWTFTSQPKLTAIQYQAETLNGQSSGPVFRTFNWNGFPDGTGTVLDSTKAGDSVTFTANFASAGTYDLHVTSKRLNTRGIWQLSIDGVNVGSPQDEYGADQTYVDFDLGAIGINSAGNHKFKFTVTGRNPLSSDYKICFDALKFNVR
jgi:Legume lectin domain/Chitobiase/beta-hexosaminidase C-terminal domain